MNLVFVSGRTRALLGGAAVAAALAALALSGADAPGPITWELAPATAGSGYVAIEAPGADPAAVLVFDGETLTLLPGASAAAVRDEKVEVAALVGLQHRTVK